ncbi:Hypothetical protein IALB_2073 [Ignavibacterium album JCM 16511]|uniref:Glycosyltransferase RgtA/B/C/D-like domain-containing protein n=1 Tax=Ignavibacterium album (strain DSM 19864 / JCM 16511 / NBRC 101810 / Mat9-16) TaxID=945713 RepID=I0ALC1_IGNAJ|nr:hypothetical protein [Ignavibacterium album]AFH49778.1 Hypothetical protein IALB_2073 [Ignavibacterium album JCM 16511]
MKIYKILSLLLLLYLVALPRFNWRPLPAPLNNFVGTKPFDVEQYEKYVEYFRGNLQIASELEGPFSYRPLVPYLASFLHFDALTSINLINLLLLSLGLIYLIKFLSEINVSEKFITIGLIIFIVSFPVFYYTTSGYIDASLIGILAITNYYLFRSKYFSFSISFTIGILIKETIIIMLPVAAVYYLTNEKTNKKYLKIIVPIFLYLITVIAIRSLVPQKENYIWNPSIENFLYNISRAKTYLTFILTLGIPGVLSLYLIFSDKKKNVSKGLLFPLVTGFLFSFLLWVYSLFSAYSDGRQLWTSYAYTIPLMLELYNSMYINYPLRR